MARCVELPAAVTLGRTDEEVIRNFEEAIHLVLEATRQYEIPPIRVVRQIEPVA